MGTEQIAVVTGASSFLARALSARLRSEGWRVVEVSREKGAGATADVLDWETFWTGKQLDLSSVTAVYHMAAYRPPNLEDPAFAAACMEANAMLTLRLAERVAHESAARFIYCSAGNIYGSGRSLVTESAPVELAGRACFYLASKYLGEVFVERTRLAAGLRACSFRVSSLYGPGMPAGNLIARFAGLAREKQPLPLRRGGAEYYDFVYSEDLVGLLMRAAASSAAGIFNAGSGESATVSQVAEWVNAEFESSAGVEDAGAGGAPPQAGFAPLEIEKVRRAFGFEPVPLKAGIAHYKEWLERGDSAR